MPWKFHVKVIFQVECGLQQCILDLHTPEAMRNQEEEMKLNDSDF